MATHQPSGEIRPVKDFPGYWVTSTGEVWTGWYPVVGGRRGEFANKGAPIRPLAISVNKKTKYRHVLFRRNTKNYNRSVHVLVLEAFIGDRPPGTQTRHLDGNPANNRLDNLAWGTARENSHDKHRHGTTSRGVRSGKAKLTDEQVRLITVLCSGGQRQADVAARFQVKQACVSSIMCGTTWKHVTGIV
jgi:hypothetical protein